MKTEILQSIHSLISIPEWEGQVFFVPDNSNRESSFLALGKEDVFRQGTDEIDGLKRFEKWLESTHWSFGVVSYDTKNFIEDLKSPDHVFLNFPSIHFIRPLVVVRFENDSVEVIHNSSTISNDGLLERIKTGEHTPDDTQDHIELVSLITRETYLSDVKALLRHIQLGDIYEVNYCQEFFAKKKLRSPYDTWLRLNALTDAPHACYVQAGNHHLLCASPELYLKRSGKKIISQPIKGTIRRSHIPEEDNRLKNELLNSKKERSENVMIVDLVRNDLSHHAEAGSVQVEELFGIKTFRTVHHMVSTISAAIPQEISFVQLLRDTFPMGSMTGAPKIRAMQLISEFEHSARGWYSGCAGYIRPNGDFEFNVIIRSLVYDDSLPYISCSVGSALTIHSDPEKEYEECLLKAEAVLRSLNRPTFVP